jgi:excisionase family DNA binding protein
VSISEDLDAARDGLRRSTPALAQDRDFLTPREVAARVGVSYYSVLRAIRRGDLAAFEVVGRLRVEVGEYDRWAHASPVQVGAASEVGERRRRTRSPKAAKPRSGAARHGERGCPMDLHRKPNGK